MRHDEIVTGVLVGGFKPEDIEREHLANKARRDAEDRLRQKTTGSGTGKPDQPHTNGAITSPGESLSGSQPIEYGRFGVDRIIQVGRDWLFMDLQTPIGTFQQVTLKGDELIRQPMSDLVQKHEQYEGSIDDWIAFASKQPEDGPRPISAPMRYALMAASWLKRDDPKDKDAVSLLQAAVWNNDMNRGRSYNGTIIEYTPNSHFVDHTSFWPAGHPLHYKIVAGSAMACGLITYEGLISKTSHIAPMLYLLEEDDPGRAFDVFKWAAGEERKRLVDQRLEFPREEDVKRDDRRAVMFAFLSPGFGIKTVQINASMDGLGKHRMRGIIAHSRHYIPLGGGSA